MSINVLIADDHPLFRNDLIAHLEGQADIRVVAQGDDGDQVLPEIGKSYEPHGDVLDSAGDGTSSYGFAAEMRDPTGLANLRARYLDNFHGRFISRDAWLGIFSRRLTLN